jgi:N-acetylneuraminate synthase
MSTPSSIAAVDLLEELNVKRYKIGSGDISNLLLLRKIALTKKPVILSSGMSDVDEIKLAINQFEKTNNKISLLQCTSKYPTKPEDIGLNLIEEYKTLFNCEVGYSDHSGNINSCLAAIALGAEMIEFHVTFDKKMFGPDSNSSIVIKELKELISGIHYIQKIVDNPSGFTPGPELNEMKLIFEKSIALNKDLEKGSIISFCDLESKKPSGMGVNVKDYKMILNKKLVKNKRKNDFLQYDDLSD